MEIIEYHDEELKDKVLIILVIVIYYLIVNVLKNNRIDTPMII